MFTGKNKKQFEKWYLHEVYNKDQQKHEVLGTWMGVGSFKLFPFSFQQGVYLEYLDSVGYIVLIDKVGEFWESYLLTTKRELLLTTTTSRQEALIEAFKKADELIN